MSTCLPVCLLRSFTRKRLCVDHPLTVSLNIDNVGRGARNQWTRANIFSPPGRSANEFGCFAAS